MTVLQEVRQIKSVILETWADESSINALLGDGWFVLTCAPGQERETGSSYVRVVLGNSSDRSAA
jgi:hypothetical protein